MSRLSRVLADIGEEYDINGEKFLLKSLTGKDIGIFDEKYKDNPKLPFDIVFASLKNTYNDITYDEVESLPLIHIQKMVALVMKASGFDENEKPTK